MRAFEFITERKKRKRAAYGPGPGGGYGYAAGYSGNGGVAAGSAGAAAVGEDSDWEWSEPLTYDDAQRIAQDIEEYVLDGNPVPFIPDFVEKMYSSNADALIDMYNKMPTVPHETPDEELQRFVNILRKYEEGELSVEEGWKDWVTAAGVASMAAGGGSAAYDAYKASQAEKEPTPIVAPAPDFSAKKKDTSKIQIPANATPKQSVTGSPHEKVLSKEAVASGITGTELAQFLGQCAHETMDFKHLKEIGGSLDFKKYEPVFHKDKKTKKVILDPKTKKPKNFNPKAITLGNDNPGDGEKYKGRGYIQLTGKYNYSMASKALGLDLVKQPELVEKPEVAAKVAVWFWQNRVQPKVDNFNDTKASTKPINKGLKGLEQRKEKFNDFKIAMR